MVVLSTNDKQQCFTIRSENTFLEDETKKDLSSFLSFEISDLCLFTFI